MSRAAQTSPSTAPPPTPVSGRAYDSPIRSRAAWARLIACTILSIALDLGSKYLAFRYVAGQQVVVLREDVLAKSAIDPRLVTTVIPRHEPLEIIPGLLEFTLVLNPGDRTRPIVPKAGDKLVVLAEDQG